jgi:hypothetical protein
MLTVPQYVSKITAVFSQSQDSVLNCTATLNKTVIASLFQTTTAVLCMGIPGAHRDAWKNIKRRHPVIKIVRKSINYICEV